MGQSLAIPRVIPNDWKRLDLIVNKIKLRLGSVASPAFINLNLTGYIDQSDIADPGAPAASKSRLFSNNGHTISIAPDDVWHDLSMGGLGTSSCVHDAITVTHVGGSGLNITWSAGTIFDATITDGDQMVTIAAQPANQACAASNINYLFFDHSAGVLVLNTAGPDYSNGDFSIAHILTIHNDIFEIIYRPVDKEVTHNIKWALREAFPNVVVSGLVVSAHGGTWDVDQSAGSFVYSGFSLKTALLIDSTATNIVRWYHNAADAWETNVNANIDNANWDDDDDGAVVIGTTAGKYYRSVFVTCGDCIHWVYPQVEYANLAAALAGPDPTLPAVLEHLPKTTVLILKHGAAGLPIVGSDQWIDVRPILGVVSTGASISDHGSLTGLGDDDHIQYIKDSEFTQDSGILVGTGAGTFQEEIGVTLRTSIGLGTGDSPTFTGLDLSGILTVDTVNEHTGAAGVTIEGILIKDSDIRLGDYGTIYFGDSSNYALYYDSNRLVFTRTAGTSEVWIGSSHTETLVAGHVFVTERLMGIGAASARHVWKDYYDVLEIGGTGALICNYAAEASMGISICQNAYYDATDSRWEYVVADEASLYSQSIGRHIFSVNAGEGAAANAAITWLASMTLKKDGGILMHNLKSGATQGTAGADANELYHDTDDDTIKIGV